MTATPPTRRSRPPTFALVLAGLLALGLVALVVDAVLATFRNVDTAVSVARQPKPTTLSLPEFADHPMLADTPMPEVACTLPEFGRTEADLTPYYEALVACLDRAWRPVLGAAGLPATRPGIELADTPGENACGMAPDEMEATAWYCGYDQVLYLPVGRMVEWDGGRPQSHLAIVAHEFGHHVQELSGLLGLAHTRMADLGYDTPAGLEVNRRMELQANCFAGLFLGAAADRGSIPRHLASGAVDSARQGAGASTHGNVRNQIMWTALGYSERNLAACDTWSATAEDVAD